jgi:NAD(P)H-hydrate epimerase
LLAAGSEEPLMARPDADPPALPWLPPRPIDSHKGDFGRVLLIGGSSGMSGAIGLAGMAALRSGAGLVTLGVPEACWAVVAGYEPSCMTLALPCDAQGRLNVAARDLIADYAEKMDCLACGPGLGRSPQVTDLVCWMYELLPQPLVLDADALFALAHRFNRLEEPAGPRLLTPHPGEFSRFMNGAQMSREHSEQLAQNMAASYGLVLLLKGHGTMITDGQQVVHNRTGNPGMATGGTGDVLTGVIAALVGQGLSPFEAAQLGAHVHGLAGDLAAEELGQTSMIASDLLRFLPRAFVSLEK